MLKKQQHKHYKYVRLFELGDGENGAVEFAKEYFSLNLASAMNDAIRVAAEKSSMFDSVRSDMSLASQRSASTISEIAHLKRQLEDKDSVIAHLEEEKRRAGTPRNEPDEDDTKEDLGTSKNTSQGALCG